MSEFEQDIKTKLKPVPTEEIVTSFIGTHWLLNIVKIKKIESYDDANFYVETTHKTTGKSSTHLVKFYNAIDTANPEILNGLSHMLARINEKVKTSVKVPSVIQPVVTDGQEASQIDYVFLDNCPVAGGDERKVAVRVFSWLAGTTLSRVTPTMLMFVQLGRGIGDVSVALDGFDHPSFHRVHLWDLKQIDMSITELAYVDNLDVQQAIIAIHTAFKVVVEPLADTLPQSVIMGDCNDANVIVTEEEPCEVSGLIDFSDAVMTWRVNEIAIAMAYALLTSYGKTHPHQALGSLLAGFVSVQPLNKTELSVLPILIGVRLSISVMIGACAISKEPENGYLKLHAVPGRDAILLLSKASNEVHSSYFKAINTLFSKKENKVVTGVDPFNTDMYNALIYKYYKVKY